MTSQSLEALPSRPPFPGRATVAQTAVGTVMDFACRRKDPRNSKRRNRTNPVAPPESAFGCRAHRPQGCAERPRSPGGSLTTGTAPAGRADIAPARTWLLMFVAGL